MGYVKGNVMRDAPMKKTRHVVERYFLSEAPLFSFILKVFESASRYTKLRKTLFIKEGVDCTYCALRVSSSLPSPAGEIPAALGTSVFSPRFREVRLLGIPGGFPREGRIERGVLEIRIVAIQKTLA